MQVKSADMEGNRSRKSRLVWEDSTTATMREDAGYAILDFEIFIKRFKHLYPDNSWALEIHAKSQGVDLHRNYSIKVEDA